MIRIEFQVEQYDGSLLASEQIEFAPIFATYSSIAGRKKSYFPIKWQNEARTDGTPFTAHTEFDHAVGDSFNRKTSTATIRIGDTVGIAVKAHSPNDHKVLSLQDCGDALIPLGQLLADCINSRSGSSALAGANEELRKKKLPIALQYFEYSEQNGNRVNKGAMLISGIRATLDGTPILLDIERDSITGKLKTPDEFEYIAANETLFNSTVSNVLMRSIAMFTEEAVAQGFSFHASREESKRVHAPFFSLPSGLLFGAAFVMRPGALAPLQSSEPEKFVAVQDWMARIGGYALNRINQSDTWFINTVNEQLARTDNTYNDEFVECSEVLGQMLAIPPTSLPYVSDEVHTEARAVRKFARIKTKNGYINIAGAEGSTAVHSVERFSEAADSDAGDCEDLAMLAYRIGTTLANGEWTNPLVKAMAALMNQYVPVINLGSVRDASVGNDLHNDSQLKTAGIIDSVADRNVSVGAHMWCELVPLTKWIAQVQRSVPDLDPNLLWLKGAVKAPWTAAIAQLVIEGTGRLNSLQLPRISYVMTDDAAATKKKAILAALKMKTALTKHFLENTKTFACMQMTRDQQLLENVPNTRINTFYRDATHGFTARFLDNGLSNIDFIYAHRGNRVPALSTGDKLFSDNSISRSLRSPVIATAATPTATTTPAPTAATATPPPPSSSSSDTITSAAIVAPFSSWHDVHGGVEAALDLVSGGVRHKPKLIAGRQEAASTAPKFNGVFQYGVPMYDRLQSPLLPATCIVPGTPLNGREVRVVSEVLRHAAPISTPGDWNEIEKMHEAAFASLMLNNNHDEAALMVTEETQFEALTQKIRAVMRTTGQNERDWPKRGSHVGKWTPLTFMFPYNVLRLEKNVDAIVADITAQKPLIRFARLMSEEAMPYRRFAVLQLLCVPIPVGTDVKE